MFVSCIFDLRLTEVGPFDQENYHAALAVTGSPRPIAAVPLCFWTALEAPMLYMRYVVRKLCIPVGGLLGHLARMTGP